eukprot:320117_1
MGADLSGFVQSCSVTNHCAEISTICAKNMIVNSFDNKTSPKSFIISSKNQEMIINITFKSIIEVEQLTLVSLPMEADIETSAPKLIHIYKSKHSGSPDKIAEYSLQQQTIQLHLRHTKCMVIHIKTNQNNTEYTYLNGIILKGGLDMDEQNAKYDENIVNKLIAKGFTRRQIIQASSMVIDHTDESLVHEQLQGWNKISQVYSMLSQWKHLQNTSSSVNMKWRCEACSFENAIYQQQCAICFTMKPNIASQNTLNDQKYDVLDDAKNNDEGWNCSQCTYLNPRNQLKCSMCEGNTHINTSNLSWECAMCTFQNSSSQVICQACSIRKPNGKMQIIDCNIDKCLCLQNISCALKQYAVINKEVALLKTIFNNILQNPNEKKYKNLNANRITKKLPNLQRLLYDAGFHKSNDNHRLLHDNETINQLLKVNEMIHNNPLDTLFIEYTQVNMMNDYHHLLFAHKSDIEVIHLYLNEKCNAGKCCDVSNCDMIRRNRRDTSNEQQFNVYNCTDPKDAMRIESIDTIHSYFCHIYDTGCIYSCDQIDQIEEQLNQEEKDTYEVKLPQIQNQSNIKNNNNSKYMLHDIYSFGYRFFYWTFYKGNTDLWDSGTFTWRNDFLREPANEHPNGTAYCLMHWFVEAKFAGLKEELTHNSICHIALNNFDLYLQKAQTMIETDTAKQMICLTDTREHDYKIFEGTPVTVQHLLAMMIYCDFDLLQKNFTETCRKIDQYEDDHSLRKRHSNFANWARLLRELVDCWGWQENVGGVLNNLYHGLNKEFQLLSIHATIKGPLSTTRSLAVAVSFCTNQGMIITLVPDMNMYIPRTNSAHAKMDCSWLSRFPHEQEVFFMGGYSGFDIRGILFSNGIDYEEYCQAICSMSSELMGMTSWFQIYSIIEPQKYKTQNIHQMIFRLLLHEMHRYYPDNTNYKSWDGIPKYIDSLLHKHCQNMRGMKLLPFESTVCALFRKCFLSDNGWIKLEELVTVFPRLNRIYLNLECNIVVQIDWICQWMLQFLMTSHRKARNLVIKHVLRRIEIEFNYSSELLALAKITEKQYNREFLMLNWFIFVTTKKRLIMLKFYSVQDDWIRQSLGKRALKGLINKDDSGLFNVGDKGCCLM